MNYYTDVLKKYAEFKGRSGKTAFWYFTAINFTISVILSFVGELINFALLSTIYSLAVLMPSLAVGARRMHDVGKSGWYFLIPFYNLYLAFQDSEIGTNQYGAEPVNN